MLFTRVFDALFPSRCVGCHRTGGVFCAACRPHPGAARRLDGGPLPVAAAGRYAGVLRQAILLYKRGRRDAGDALADLVAERFARLLPPGAILVPVPTTLGRRRSRGFDQSVRLARALGARTGLPVLLALAQVAGDAQRGRSRAARLTARDRFACTAPGLVAGAHVVLVDDVMTTGATLRDCAAALARCGAVVEAAIVVAYA